MNKAREFVTCSHYEGHYNDIIHSMEGYGQYTFPDGSVYRGYLKKGKFHGYGSVHLAPPYSFTIKGYFDHGRLKLLDEIIFSDGLRMTAPFAGTKLYTYDWSYITPHDRRMHNEYINGVDAVGPSSLSTKRKRNLPINTFDTEEGIYVADTGFLRNIQPPFNKRRFVGNDGERQWIREFCRSGHETKDTYQINTEMCGRIIEANFKQVSRLGERTRRCGCKFYKDITAKCKELDKIRAQVKPEKPKDQESLTPLENSQTSFRYYNYHCYPHVMRQLEEQTSSDYFSLHYSPTTISDNTLKNIHSIVENVKDDCFIETTTLDMPKEITSASQEYILWRSSIFDSDRDIVDSNRRNFL